MYVNVVQIDCKFLHVVLSERDNAPPEKSLIFAGLFLFMQKVSLHFVGSVMLVKLNTTML